MEQQRDTKSRGLSSKAGGNEGESAGQTQSEFHVKWDFAQIKEDKILEKLRQAEEALEDEDLDKALVDFNKVLFYDKTIPEVFVEKAEIYIKLCDFSSAI